MLAMNFTPVRNGNRIQHFSTCFLHELQSEGHELSSTSKAFKSLQHVFTFKTRRGQRCAVVSLQLLFHTLLRMLCTPVASFLTFCTGTSRVHHAWSLNLGRPKGIQRPHSQRQIMVLVVHLISNTKPGLTTPWSDMKEISPTKHCKFGVCHRLTPNYSLGFAQSHASYATDPIRYSQRISWWHYTMYFPIFSRPSVSPSFTVRLSHPNSLSEFTTLCKSKAYDNPKILIY